MNKHTRVWPKICSALIIALATSIVWGFALIWCGYLAMQIVGTTEQVYESVQVADDGTPVIQTASNRRVQDQTLRTLDGQPFDLEGRQWLTAALFRDLPEPPRLFNSPISWPQRVVGISDMQRQPTSWYLVRNAASLGHAYLVGYDEQSKLCVGYIGRQGFRRAIPPQDQWFDLGRNLLDWSNGVFTSTAYVQIGGRAYGYQQAAEAQRLAPWLAFLIDGDRLLEINLRARSLRTLYESPGTINVAIVTEPPPADQVQRAPANPPAAADDPAVMPKVREPLISRLALRLSDRIVIIDPPTGDKREFTLPESLRERPLYAYLVRPDELLLQWWPKESFRGPTELAWLKPDGTFAREESVVLATQAQESERTAFWMAAGVAPVPIGWLAIIFIFAPMGMLQVNQAATYGEALAKGFGFAWPAFIAVIVLGIVLAWITYRLQRKYRRPGTGAWTTFVQLLGVPGLLAYLLEHNHAKLESCSACGEIVPRDREACAACDAQFPTPPLVGTEIFA